MEFSRFLLCCIFIFFSYLLHANTQQTSNPGIAFVHGTNDHRRDALGGYWKQSFINSVSHALPNPANHYVVKCDFRHYMWREEAAGCMTEQLLSFAKERKLTSLTLYTHSDGANVMRWVLSNPTFDERYMALSKVVTQVIAIAPSSGGTPLADETIDGNLIVEGVGWLLGFRTDSVRQQRVGDMAIFNHEIMFGSPGRPSLPVPFRVIVGTDVTASPITAASYCNGYILNAALKITRLYLNKCADGFLNCTSQRAAGDVWFYDRQKTKNKANLSHNQSRHACVGLERILQDDLIKGVA